jgi:hypothetical protein
VGHQALAKLRTYLMGRRPHLSEGRKQGSSSLQDHVCGAEKQPSIEKTPQWSGLYRNKKRRYVGGANVLSKTSSRPARGRHSIRR